MNNSALPSQRGDGFKLAYPILFLLLVAPLALTGCVKAKKKDEKSSKKSESPVPKLVDLGAGDTTVYKTEAPNSPPSYTVNWKTGGFKSGDKGVELGHLTDVSGDLYSDGTRSSQYRSDRADATKVDKRLVMTGNVVVHSVDGTKWLHAPRAEYHGDVGFVRAMDGVTAKGPFGTLSGAPELWATPDLSLIGTPDMVSQKLKIPALIALAATIAHGTPVLQGVDFRFVGARSVFSQRIDPKNPKSGDRIIATPAGGVPATLIMEKRGIVIHSAGTITLLTAANGAEIRHITTVGKVEVIQTGTNKKTTLDGNGSEYDVKPGSNEGNLSIGGRVTITSVSDEKDAAGKTLTRTVVSKGDQGSAVLYVKPPTGVDPMKSSTLIGNVTIDIRGTTGTFLGSGDRLVYTPNLGGAQAVMTGTLKFSGDAPAYLGNIEGANLATVNLDKDGWKDITLEDTGGKPTTTTISDKKTPPLPGTPPKKGGKKPGELH